MSHDIGIWIAALLTLGIYSFLYKDNPAYKLCEHLFVGVSAGYYVVLMYFSVVKPNLLDPLFTVYPALRITGFGQGDLVEQIHGTMLPLWVRGNLGTTIGNWLLVGGLLTTLIFFFFSKEHKGALGGAARIGVYFLMVSFGASYGYTVMARISLLIGRVMFLLHDWLGVLHL
ncbi:MAG: hypothetical protein E6K71_01960 [Candidatus Eisenbacteria bacterium]|uniref:Uncharacterized protein n=1 Tax=Eiseniibacteriota bacterium TaxID=2212470 RepID=A0A538SH38_UNCEI|nr:MAG: hypothetical protein E6K71_01960 [Candidatus Eisenbacteria bacterium]